MRNGTREMGFTLRLSLSAVIGGQKCGGRHNLGPATGVAWPRAKQSEVAWEFHCLVGRTSHTDADLEGGDRGRGVLAPRREDAAFAAVRELLVVRHTRQQVHDCRVFLAAMRNVAFEL